MPETLTETSRPTREITAPDSGILGPGGLRARFKHPVHRYILSLLITGGLLVTSYFLFKVFPHHPGLFCIAAVVVTAWKLGRGPGMLSAVIGAFAVRPLFLPVERLIPPSSEFVRLGIYFALTFLISALVGARRRAEAALMKSNEELEKRVKERTEELRSTNEELEQSLAQLQRSNEALEQFAYVCSHDLKEPLRTMTVYVELLKSKYAGKLDPEADEFIDYVVSGSTKMNELISSLLEFSRAGRSVTLERLDAGAVVAGVLQSMEPLIRESGAKVTVGSLPIIEAERSQIVRLFQNLIANAIKYRSEAPPKIEISAKRESVNWLFAVTDNGMGIDPAYHERIFVLFQRLHHRDTHPGAGIGLAICRQIVERHHGRIWVESKPGAGSTFYFTLPARSA